MMSGLCSRAIRRRRVSNLKTEHDYYSVLGITRNSSQEQIKRAYRKAVFRYHPDRNPGDNEAAGKFKQVLHAYEILSDALRRAKYDQKTRPAQSESDAEEELADKESPPQFSADPGNGFHFTQDFKQKVEPEPKCPSCSVVGSDRIVSRKAGSNTARGKQFILAPFNVIFCNACGHVYGVTASST
jgi:curved DNA-binding protein CbpA